MSYSRYELHSRFWGFFWGTFVLLGVVAFLTFILWVWPTYNVWRSEMGGRAAMARAEQDRQIKVREAQADLDAADLLAQAEIKRAEGVAKSNTIVADGLGGPTGYLRYLYIQSLGNIEKNGRTIVYVPTDGLLPVTEAMRLKEDKQ